MYPEDKVIRTVETFEENLKKALTEMLVLSLLQRREYYIGELTTDLDSLSGGSLNIVFPYGVIYRMTRSEYIVESKKRTAPDGRLRQYYQITEAGRSYLTQLLAVYNRFTAGVADILQEVNVHE